jgi:hypothetical protein
MKRQFESEAAVALKPVVLRYASGLESARSSAQQRGDTQSAIAAENALAELRAKHPNIPIPGSPKLGAPSNAAPSPLAVLNDLRKQMGNTKWSGDDGGHMTFGGDGIVVTSWGTRGEWNIVTPRRMTIEWAKGKKEEMTLEPDLKTFATGKGIKWKRN